MAAVLPGLASGHHHLPFQLDLSCPISLPSRPPNATAWPYVVAGPSRYLRESDGSFVTRRYYETLYLSDILSPLTSLVLDLLRLSSPRESIKPLILSLPGIEARHRKTLQPVISSVISSHGNPSELQRKLLEGTLSSSGMSKEEVQVVKTGMSLRLGCRAVSEGAVHLTAKKVSDELEKREVLIQIVLLLLYTSSNPDGTVGVSSPNPGRTRRIPKGSFAKVPIDKGTSIDHPMEQDTKPLPGKHKRKRDRQRGSSPVPAHPIEDPRTALELLSDRLSVWQAVAELGIGFDHFDPATNRGRKQSDKDDTEHGIQGILKRFWSEVILASFMSKQPDFCASLHLKLFGQAIPSNLMPAPPVKKSRKPKITHPHPAAASSRPQIQEKEKIRASSETRYKRDPSAATDFQKANSMGRSVSRLEFVEVARRSRSRSIDAVNHVRPPQTTTTTANKPVLDRRMIRAPSGKDLFKGREVGLIRRTNSTARQADKKEESQSKVGLLGRKTSDPKTRPSSLESQTQTQAQSRPSGTLIFATPSKPRLFGPGRAMPQQWNQPTPIREEPSSDERRAPRVAETPLAARTGPLWAPPDNAEDVDAESRGESDDPLADWMVMTDDEEESGGSAQLIPETPAK